ncbi:MAG: cytochrome c oxidase subunit II [Candidatus Peregrinibacteria bacterium Greene0416_62]|nr:MAG: cytochrome c oxidase subunit II [Candidatus Peregrinibacteria bacterium Greene0416_62]
MPVPGNTVEEQIVSGDDDQVPATEDTGGNGETGGAMVPSSKAPAASVRMVEITASNFAFTPSMITVKKGEEVTLNLIGESGIHGIGIPGFGISQRVDLGQTVSIAIPTDTAGTFDFKCNVPCGSGHKEMKGTIVIEE